MPNISKKTLIIGGIVIMCLVIAVIVLAVNVSKKKTESTESSKERDNRLINDALKRSGIQTKNEPFQNNTDIVFDSYDKIKNNFDLFMNTYYPLMNINEMNDMLKTKYGVPKTMQELIMENLDAPNMDGYIQGITMLSVLISWLSLDDYLTKGISADIICAYLALIVVKNIDNRMNEKIVYLNDFDKSDDFYIYILPQSYDVSKLSTNNDIPIIDIFNDNNDSAIYYSGNDLIKPYKIGFISIIKYRIKENIQLEKLGNNETTVPSYDNISSIPVSEDEINKYVKILGNNRMQMLKFYKLMYIAGFIVLYNKKELPASSQIKLDMKEALKSSNFSEEFLKSITIPTDDYIDNNKFNDFGVLENSNVESITNTFLFSPIKSSY
jgi:hypothetical protein